GTLATGECPSRSWSLPSPRRSVASPPRLRGATASTSDATRSSSRSTSRTCSSPKRYARSITDGRLAPSWLGGPSVRAAGGAAVFRGARPSRERAKLSAKRTGGGVTTMPYRVARYRLLLVKDGTLPTTWDRQLRQSGDVAKLMVDVVAGLDREAFFVVLLDGKNRVSGINLVSL